MSTKSNIHSQSIISCVSETEEIKTAKINNKQRTTNNRETRESIVTMLSGDGEDSIPTTWTKYQESNQRMNDEESLKGDDEIDSEDISEEVDSNDYDAINNAFIDTPLYDSSETNNRRMTRKYARENTRRITRQFAKENNINMESIQQQPLTKKLERNLSMDLKWNDQRDKEDFTREGVMTIVNTKNMVPLILRVPKVPMSQECISSNVFGCRRIKKREIKLKTLNKLR